MEALQRCWSWLSFSWAYTIIKDAADHTLEQDDVSSLVPEKHQSAQLASAFEKAFIAVQNKRPRFYALLPNLTLWTLAKIHAKDIFDQCLWTILEVIARLIGPLVLRQFVLYLLNDKDDPQWQGWLLAVALGASGMAYTLCHHRLFWKCLRLGFLCRQQVITALHEKVLRLNATCIAEVSFGKVVTLASNDTRRFDDGAPYWTFLWAGPLELAAVLIMVSLELNAESAFAGLSALLLLVPVQAGLTRFITRIRNSTAECTDERVRLSGEAINGVLAMKMLSWEEPLSAAVLKIRQQEASHIRYMAFIRAINSGLYFCITPLSTFITFAVFHATGGTMNPAMVFYVVSLINLPRLYMVTFFTNASQTITELMVSLRRVDTFLRMPEPPALQLDAEAPEGTVAMRGADYDWQFAMGQNPEGGEKEATNSGGNSKSSEITLHGVTFQMPPGELLGICGPVGSGKSSLLAALLGEVQPLPEPEAEQKLSNRGPLLAGSVAYCSQVPCIMNSTVRDNILFGKPYEEKWYQQVLAACALEEDIAGLPAGDLTELGERGINLSGGQKARVSLARSCYSRATIQLLDDPLSAVDPKVGSILFNRCIGPRGLMAGTTRLLVTHQRQALPHCDRVMLLLGGRVEAMGSWEEVGATVAKHTLTEEEMEDGVGMYEELDDEGASSSTDASLAGVGPEALDSRTGPMAPEQTSQPAFFHTAAAGAHQSNQPTCEIQLSSLDAPMDFSSKVVPTLAPQGVSSASAGSGSVDSEERKLTTPDLNVKVVVGVADEGELGSRAAAEGARAGYESQDADVRKGVAPDLNAKLEHATSGKLALFRQRTFAQVRNSIRLYHRPQSAAHEGEEALAEAAKPAGQLVTTEERARGEVSWGVYGAYASYISVNMTLVITVSLFAGQAVVLAAEWWLANWSNSSDQGKTSWLWVYALLTGISIVASMARTIVFYDSTLRAASRLHEKMVRCVFRAPLSFFHTNPSGRILNRFSKDQGQVDDLLPLVLCDATQIGVNVLGAFVLSAIAVPVVLPVYVPLVILFWILRERFMLASRDVKRWEAVTRSPIYAGFSATIRGLSTIRAFNAQARSQQAFLEVMDPNINWYYAFLGISRWLGFRLDLISNATLVATAILAMATRGSIHPQILSLALALTLQLTGTMQWFVRQASEVENNMTSTERIREYTMLPQEPPTLALGGAAPPAGWPSSGRIEYTSVSARYRPGLPPVLKNLSFLVPANSSCGVVGRTGSGKSSLMLTLFRLIEVMDGQITLDGLDISTIGLDALRRQLAIIPQDPVLFSGTLRSNLDPWGGHGDNQLWEVLGTVQLSAAIKSMGGLDATMAESGTNLSVGQRQLLCLARALLQRAFVLALDEATANVDRATDALIQKALRQAVSDGSEAEGSSISGGRVLIVIAHRLDTVMDCNQIIVLSAGELVESGPPEELLQRPEGVFARMHQVAQAEKAGHKR